MTVTAGLPYLAAIDQEARRAKVRGNAPLDGIDFVEVLSNHVGSTAHIAGVPEQRTLLVHLVNGPADPAWDAEVVRILGGVRAVASLNPVGVVWAYDALSIVDTDGVARSVLPTGVTEADAALVSQALVASSATPETIFVVRTDSAGDFSSYLLRLAGPSGEGAPAGIDLPLSVAPFGFKVDCPSGFDCATCRARPPVEEQLLPGDYLARDYEALRTRLLDRLSTRLPGWDDRNPADPAVMIAELFAAVGDRLAYWQDAVAVEAYLGTARRRASVRRHARLLGYRVHEGCSARTLLAIEVDAGTVSVAARLPVTDLDADPRNPAETGIDAVERGGTVFETRAPILVSAMRNQLPLYAWGDPDHCLPAGATAAFLMTDNTVDPGLKSGDLLVLAARPPNGDPRQGDPALRFGVQLVADARRHTDGLNPAKAIWEIRWGAADALAAPLPVTMPSSPDAAVAVALANVVVADHGGTVARQPTVPASLERDVRPRLEFPGLAYTDEYFPPAASVRALLSPDPRRARAFVELDDGQRVWTAQPDLIASGRLDTHFVVEPEPGGVSRLRFGDGVNGRAPSAGPALLATYRIGSGSQGDIGPGVLHRPLWRPNGTSPPEGVTIWNPLPATGGTDPEGTEQVRQLAPASFRVQLRAVTSADYAAVAEQDSGTQKAVARRRWTGSWYAQEVTLDPVEARTNDETLVQEVASLLETRRMAGIDVELGRPVYVPLRLVVRGCVKPGYLRPDVESRLRDRFSTGIRPDGGHGFFHPDRFTFGQPLRLSDVVAAAMATDGLAWVELIRFARADATPAQAVAALAAGVLAMQPRELLRCNSDPSNPESGGIEFLLGGGS